MGDSSKKEIEKKGKLNDKQKEILITVGTLLLSVILGFFIGKFLFDMMNGNV